VSLGLVAIDGEIVPREAASVSVYDRGFVYGDSVFETMRTYGGVLFRLGDHMARLGRSLGVVGITPAISPAALGDEIARLVSEARAHLGSSAGAPSEMTARVMVTRGEAPLGLVPRPGHAASRRVLFLEPYAPPPDRAYAHGIALVTAPTYRPSDAARGAKVGNYLESILVLQRAREAGADEALIIDAGGFVVEGTTSNVFVVHGAELSTPPASSSLLPGITRMTVMEVARERGTPVVERPLTPADVASASEVFITSTLRGVMPAASVDGRALPAARPVTSALREAFLARAGA
jgi:branched-chain amino acid aminotransferase